MCYIYFLKNILFVLEKGKEGKREGEKHQCAVAAHAPLVGDLTWLATQAGPLTGNQTGNPLVHRPAFNPLSHHQPGLSVLYILLYN